MGQEIFRQQALDKFNSPDDLNELVTVTSPKSWLLLAGMGLLILSAGLWSLFARIETAVPGRGVLLAAGENLEAVLYVSIGDARQIQPGMAAKIAPNTVRREEFGMLRATVVAVAALPATEAEMLAVLGNDALVQSLASAGAIVAVRLQLEPDGTTQSGYRWTSADGPPVALASRTFSEGSIVVDEQRPIELLLVR